MKFRHFLITVVAALTATASAWGQYSVTCQVNNEDGEGEPFATVRIYALPDTVHTKVVAATEADGSFSHTLAAPGNYRLSVTAVGKVVETRAFTVDAAYKKASLGTINLTPAANELAEVVVKSQRPLVKNEIDRLSYDIANDDESKTKTVMEMLRKVPLVSVDGEDNIKVKGGTNFKIYKNGHPDPTLSSHPKEVLKAIPASMIKRIEVITEPGAKYDAEGVSAILNIVVSENTTTSGVTGTVSASASTQGFNANGYVTTQIDKVVTSINYGYVRRPTWSGNNYNESLHHYVENGNELKNEGDSENSANVHYGNIEASYEPDTLNLVSLSFGGYYYNYIADALSSTRMSDAAGNTIYSYNNRTHFPKNSYYSFDGRLDYQHKTRRWGETLTLSYMLSTSRNRSAMEYRYEELVNFPVPYNGIDQNGKEKFYEHTVQLDWTRPFAKYHKFETGLKYINRTNDSHTWAHYLGLESDDDTRLDHNTQVAAAYLSYTFSRGPWSARAGLRYEYSYLSAKYPDGKQANYHRHLSDWVPSASLNYQFSPFNSLKWAFSTRIQRPGISFLNPAIVETPTTISYGNSHLGSARIYSMSLTFMHIGPKFTFNVSPGTSFSDNQVTAVNFNRDGREVTTYENTLEARDVSLNGFFQWQVFDKTSLMFNGNVSHNWLRSKGLGLKNKGWDHFCYLQLTQRLPWKLTLTANIGEWGGNVNGLYSKSNTNFFYGFGLRRSFLKEDRLSVSINANRPFSGKYSGFKTSYVNGDYTGFDNVRFPSRRFSISISYRFGSLNTHVKKANKSIENDDVVGGSQQGGQGQGGQQGGQQGGN